MQCGRSAHIQQTTTYSHHAVCFLFTKGCKLSCSKVTFLAYKTSLARWHRAYSKIRGLISTICTVLNQLHTARFDAASPAALRVASVAAPVRPAHSAAAPLDREFLDDSLRLVEDFSNDVFERLCRRRPCACPSAGAAHFAPSSERGARCCTADQRQRSFPLVRRRPAASLTYSDCLLILITIIWLIRINTRVVCMLKNSTLSQSDARQSEDIRSATRPLLIDFQMRRTILTQSSRRA
jgi:hypothetical protein